MKCRPHYPPHGGLTAKKQITTLSSLSASHVALFFRLYPLLVPSSIYLLLVQLLILVSAVGPTQSCRGIILHRLHDQTAHYNVKRVHVYNSSLSCNFFWIHPPSFVGLSALKPPMSLSICPLHSLLTGQMCKVLALALHFSSCLPVT